MRCSRTSSTASASIRRVAVSGRSDWLNSARYGSENCRCSVTSTASSGSPSASVRPVMTPTGWTLGTSRRLRERSSSYSRYATSSPISLTAMTRPDSRAKRTMWREMPRGRAARFAAGQSSSAMCHGRSSRAGSGAAVVICSRWGRGLMAQFSQRDLTAGRRRGGPGQCRTRPVVVRWMSDVGDALARAGVEQVLLTGADEHRDRLALGGNLPRVDADDDLRVAGTRRDRRRGAELVGQRAVDEGVRAELLDEVDLDGDRVRRARCDDIERLGPEADDELVLVVGLEARDDGAGDRDAGAPDLREALEHRERPDVHRGGADEAGDEHVVGRVVHVARGADLLQDTVLEDRDAVTHGQGLGLVVRDVDGRDAEAALERRDLRAGLDTELGVEVRQRLVHEEHLGRTHDRAAHRDALTLATREGLRLAVQVLGEVEDLGGVLDARADLGLRGAGDLEREAHVVSDGHVRVQRVVLEDHRDVAVLGLHVGDLAVADQDAAGVDVLEAREHAERGRLATARGADEDEELAVLDVQVERVDCGTLRPGVDPCRVIESDCCHDDSLHRQVRAGRSVVRGARSVAADTERGSDIARATTLGVVTLGPRPILPYRARGASGLPSARVSRARPASCRPRTRR